MGFNSIGIIDDPIKNREEAESPTIRNKIWEWYTDTFYTRRDKFRTDVSFTQLFLVHIFHSAIIQHASLYCNTTSLFSSLL